MRRRLVPLLAAAAAVLGMAFAAPAHAAYAAFDTYMTGAQEVPGPGDPDGFGSAIVTVDSSTGRICTRLHTRYIAPATAAHIHVGAAGTAGPVVLPLPTPSSGFSYGCAHNVPLARAIIANPHDYYVNVHNVPYPGGAIRGQL